MTADRSIKLTFSQNIEETETSLKCVLNTVQPHDTMEKVTGWFANPVYEWKTTANADRFIANFFNGKIVGFANKHVFIPNLGQTEVVNYHQWKGRQPAQTVFKSGKVHETERPLWEIVAVDQASLERISFGFTHADRDDVFKLQMRFSQIFDAVKVLLAPWDDLARMHFTNGYKSLSDVPETQQEASKEMLEDIKQEWAENTPVWAK